jgi:uncharacterized integral membrane protein (TIGR00697 family)
MFFRVFSSLIKDTLSIKNTAKYKIAKLEQESNKVECEVIKDGKIIVFTLDDIIKNKLAFFSTTDVLALTKKYFKKGLAETTNPKETKYFSILSLSFILLLLLSNIAGTKLCDYWGFTMTGGIIFFPFLYIINDIITEIYGFMASRHVILTGLIASVIFNLLLYIVVLLPEASFSSDYTAFNTIFSLSPRIFIASLLGYYLGEFINATILTLLRIRFKGKFFVFRAIISTFIGALIESVIFCGLVFYDKLSIDQILMMAITATLVKVCLEIIVMPITLKVIGIIKS